MLAPFLATAILGFAAPKSSLSVPAKPSLLKLRGGGVSTDVLYNTQIGLTLAAGLQGWLTPVSTLETYGVTGASAGEAAYTRVVSGINLVLAATMIAAKTSLEAGVTTAAIAWALAICYNVPLFEQFDVPKTPLIGFIGGMGAIGALAWMGVLPANVAFYVVVPFMLIAVSIGELLGPDQVLDMYKMPSSPLVKSLLTNFDFVKVRERAHSPTQAALCLAIFGRDASGAPRPAAPSPTAHASLLSARRPKALRRVFSPCADRNRRLPADHQDDGQHRPRPLRDGGRPDAQRRPDGAQARHGRRQAGPRRLGGAAGCHRHARLPQREVGLRGEGEGAGTGGGRLAE